MPTYKYECSKCGDERIEVMTFAEHDIFEPGAHLLNDEVAIVSRVYASRLCGLWEQVYDFSFKRGFTAHYNPSLGHHISSEREASEHLKRQSEEATARTGVDHDYELVDPGEPSSVGVTDQGMDATERRHRELGWSEPTSKIL